MFRNAFSFGGMLVFTGAVVFVIPTLGQAQHGGGGHGGGSHFGGTHFGDYHGGSYAGGNYGGYHQYSYHPGSGYRGSYSPHYGYGHHYYGSYPLYGYYPSNGLYSYDSGYSGSYSYDPLYAGSSSDPYPYDNPRLQPDLRDSGSDGEPVPGGLYGYSPDSTAASTGQPLFSAAPTDTTARVTVKVPAGADVWFEGSDTKSRGPIREFQSPPLTPGYRYTYHIRARWNENGRDVTQTQQVAVNAGASVRVDFPVPPATAVQASITK